MQWRCEVSATMLSAMEVLSNCIPVDGSCVTPSDAGRALGALDAVIEADNRIIQRARKKAGGGFWMVSNEDMESLRAALSRVGGGA